MGPRKQVTTGPKRHRAPSVPVRGAERRTKARHDPEAQPSRPLRPRPPASPPAERVSGKVIAGGRRVDFSCFDKNGFAISGWMRRAGLVSFCSLTEKFYPHLIREFYGSLGRGAEGWSSEVRGVRILLTEELIGRVWDIPVRGSSADCLSDRTVGFQCILQRDDVSGISVVSANQLSVEMRLLHHIVARILVPKTGRFDFITERELVLMTSIVQGIPVNLPAFMARQMQEAATRSRLCLPYGMGLTRIFRDHGVPLDGAIARDILHTDTYDDRSLHRMGYRKIGERWTRRGEPEHETDSEDEIRAAEAGPSTTADGLPASPPPACVAPSPPTRPAEFTPT